MPKHPRIVLDMAGEVTQILGRLVAGDGSAVQHLLPLVYRELRGLAGRYLDAERAEHTLQPTALVHEAFIRLVGPTEVPWKDRAHFLGIAARSMRQVLVDHARKRQAAKRGGEVGRVTLRDTARATPRDVVDLVALDDALEALAELDTRQARIVELRFFGGLTVKETAQVLGISESTVECDWRMARAWLHRELGGEST